VARDVGDELEKLGDAQSRMGCRVELGFRPLSDLIHYGLLS